jgi:16S rRNA (cytosine967-C5)-methyltransferase
MNVSPARIAAFKVLLRIERDRAFSSVLLPQFEQNLSQADRSLCHKLVLGTLRRQINLDRVISHFTKGKRLDLVVRVAARLGLYQLFFLDRIPHHSAVHESVNLVQIAGKTSAKGFVNAILRNAIRNRPTFSHEDDIDRISVETSHPRWLLERWIGQFGVERAERIASANNISPGFAFRSLSGEARVPVNARPSEFVDGCFLTDSMPGDSSAFAECENVYFQDEGSQLIAASLPQADRFLDVCAAPGGKTGFVATHQQPRMIVAGDLYWPRVQLLRDNCLRQGGSQVRTIQYNAEISLPFADESFGSVFVDAPCSGTGTIRHNPEIRYFVSPADIEALCRKQLSILINASKMVSRGGSLIYSTCSLEREENEVVCEKFLAESIGFEPIMSRMPERFITTDGFARTFPDRDRMDGFFIAEMRRS